MLPVQRSQVPSLVRELDPTCHNYEIGHAATKTSIFFSSKELYFLDLIVMETLNIRSLLLTNFKYIIHYC